jgi:hypothetical protein
MNLYLKHGKKLSTVTSIYLKDFHIPAVGTVEIDHTVEPAIWFKSLIIDSMYIDCDSRNVFWREKSQDDNTESELEEPSPFVPRMTRAIYDDGDCEDFELFDAVVKLLKAIEHKTFSEVQRAQEILRILHLYILPELVLKTRDVTLLQDALEMVEGQIATTSKSILGKNSGICLTEKSLKAQRDKLYTENNFESETYLKTCNADFLGELLYDVERDIESLNYDLSSQQSEVDRLREAVTDEGRDKLQRIRQARDEIFKSIQKYQAIRETIKNVTVRAPSKKHNKCKRNHYHEKYLELKGRLLKEKQSVKILCEQKLKMASVREAIVQVRDELLQKEESYGFQTSREGHGTSTDVLELNNNKPSKWQTVEDKVKTIVHDGTSGPSMSLKSFCESINTKMKALMKEHDFCNLSADDPSKENGMADGDSDEFEYISYTEGPVNKQESNFHVKEGRISSGYRPYTHTIKEDILRHIKEQSRWLMDSLEMESYTEKGKLSIQLPQKVSACYESQLYNQIMTPLSQLYYLSYVDFASKLKEFIAKKSLIELGIDEPWLNDEMPTPPVAIKQKFHEHEEVSMALKDSSLKSGLSLTLRRMTLDELYQSAEKECDDIPDSLHSPFDDDIYGGCDMQNLEDVSRSSIISIATGQESTRSSIIVEIETVAEVMEPACHAFGHCVQATSVVEKMKTFTKGYRLLNNKVCRLKSMYRRGSVDSMVCCDEILSASIVLLTLLRKEEFVQIYSNLNLMIDLMPSFLIGSVHDCSLTNFYSAYQYLFDKQVSLNRVSTLSTCR